MTIDKIQGQDVIKTSLAAANDAAYKKRRLARTLQAAFD